MNAERDIARPDATSPAPPAGPVLVTGATGFVGSAVARALAARGETLRLLVRRGGDRRNLAGLDAELAEGDLTDPASLRRAVAGCARLYHVAADYRLWVPDPAAMLRANVDGTTTLLTAAAEAGVSRMVYCSSVAALGVFTDGTVADEDTPVDSALVIGTYKQSKYRAEQAVLALARERALPVVIVNPSTPVGPRDVKPTPTGRMIADAAAGRMPAYVDTGLNVVHVDDVAAGHLLAMQRGRVGERYILGGEDFSLGDLFATVARIAGRRPPRIRLPRQSLYPLALACEALAKVAAMPPLVTREMLAMSRKKMFFSSAKARAELDYAPRPAEDAVRDAVAWFRAQGMIPPARAHAARAAE
jgi:dihydroflavonol-4-reductase